MRPDLRSTHNYSLAVLAAAKATALMASGYVTNSRRHNFHPHPWLSPSNHHSSEKFLCRPCKPCLQDDFSENFVYWPPLLCDENGIVERRRLLCPGWGRCGGEWPKRVSNRRSRHMDRLYNCLRYILAMYVSTGWFEPQWATNRDYVLGRVMSINKRFAVYSPVRCKLFTF